MRPSKRKLCYERVIEDGSTPKRLGYETATSNASRSESLLMDLDLAPSESDAVARRSIAGTGDEKICYGAVSRNWS